MPLPGHLEVVQIEYAAALQRAPVDDDTRRAYTSRVRQYLAWLGAAAVDRDPLADSAGRDWAVRDYRAHLQSVAKRKPSTINTTLAAIADFYIRRGLGPPEVRRLELPQSAPRALTPCEATRRVRAVQGCTRPRDRLLGLIPFYAGHRIGEAVALDVDEVRLSARKGLLVVRSGKGERYCELPVHPELRANLATWLDERPDWPGSSATPALFLNHRGGRLTTRGSRDILVALAAGARLEDEFTSHVLRHLRHDPGPVWPRPGPGRRASRGIAAWRLRVATPGRARLIGSAPSAACRLIAEHSRAHPGPAGEGQAAGGRGPLLCRRVQIPEQR